MALKRRLLVYRKKPKTFHYNAKALPEGTVRDWGGQQYKKESGEWVKVKRGKGSQEEKEQPKEKKEKEIIPLKKNKDIPDKNNYKRDLIKYANKKELEKGISDLFNKNGEDLKNDILYKIIKEKIGSNLSEEEIIDYFKDKEMQEAIKKNLEFSLKEGIEETHWGMATSDNKKAISFAFINSTQFNPTDNIKKDYSDLLSPLDVLISLRKRKLAQEEIKNYSQEKYPEVYRGMFIPKKEFDNLKIGNEITMTGCSSFSFREEVAEDFSNPAIVGIEVKEKQAHCVFKIKRDDNFDYSIGALNYDYMDKEYPLYEVLSGVSKIKIKNIKKENNINYIEIEGIYE